MANPVESGSRRGSEDLALRPVKVTPRAKAPAPTQSRRYWLGVTLDAPFSSTSRGGVAFQKWGGTPEFNEATGAPTNSPPVGAMADLTESQVRLIKERVENVVVRLARNEASKTPNKEYVLQWIFLASTPNYTPAAADVPLGHFLYMVPVLERMKPNWRESEPERMVDERSMLALCSAPAPAGAAAG